MADYGTDISCINDIASDSRTVTGTTVVGESVARRLMTPRGRLIGYPNYGFDLTQYVNADMSNRDIASLRAAVVAECLKDERVASAAVDATLDKLGVLTLSIQIDLSTESFTLVLSASETTVSVLSMSP